MPTKRRSANESAKRQAMPRSAPIPSLEFAIGFYLQKRLWNWLNYPPRQRFLADIPERED
jgi:hypothetical protein